MQLAAILSGESQLKLSATSCFDQYGGLIVSPFSASCAKLKSFFATLGLLGIPVERVVGDDLCDGGMAATVAKHHVEQDKINFVIGPLCSNVATLPGLRRCNSRFVSNSSKVC